VDLVADEDIRPAQELRGHNDDRGGAVADFLVLQLSQVDQDLIKWKTHTERGR